MKIAVLDDDKTQLQLIQQALVGGDRTEFDDSECRFFQSGEELLNIVKQEAFDVVILDRKVPDMSGDVILQWIRQYGMERFGIYTIVIMLTSMNLDEDELYALRVGADDYLTKPVSPSKLVLRIRRLLAVGKGATRTKQEAILASQQTLEEFPKLTGHKNESLEFSFPGVEFDAFRSEVVLHGGQAVKLTVLEFSLALLLVKNMGIGVSNTEIYDQVWGARENRPNLATHIHKLRIKLNLTIDNGFILRNIYGFGYRLDRSIGNVL